MATHPFVEPYEIKAEAMGNVQISGNCTEEPMKESDAEMIDSAVEDENPESEEDNPEELYQYEIAYYSENRCIIDDDRDNDSSQATLHFDEDGDLMKPEIDTDAMESQVNGEKMDVERDGNDEEENPKALTVDGSASNSITIGPWCLRDDDEDSSKPMFEEDSQADNKVIEIIPEEQMPLREKPQQENIKNEVDHEVDTIKTQNEAEPMDFDDEAGNTVPDEQLQSADGLHQEGVQTDMDREETNIEGLSEDKNVSNTSQLSVSAETSNPVVSDENLPISEAEEAGLIKVKSDAIDPVAEEQTLLVSERIQGHINTSKSFGRHRNVSSSSGSDLSSQVLEHQTNKSSIAPSVSPPAAQEDEESQHSGDEKSPVGIRKKEVENHSNKVKMEVEEPAPSSEHILQQAKIPNPPDDVDNTLGDSDKNKNQPIIVTAVPTCVPSNTRLQQTVTSNSLEVPTGETSQSASSEKPRSGKGLTKLKQIKNKERKSRRRQAFIEKWNKPPPPPGLPNICKREFLARSLQEHLNSEKIPKNKTAEEPKALCHRIGKSWKLKVEFWTKKKIIAERLNPETKRMKREKLAKKLKIRRILRWQIKKFRLTKAMNKVQKLLVKSWNQQSLAQDKLWMDDKRWEKLLKLSELVVNKGADKKLKLSSKEDELTVSSATDPHGKQVGTSHKQKRIKYKKKVKTVDKALPSDGKSRKRVQKSSTGQIPKTSNVEVKITKKVRPEEIQRMQDCEIKSFEEKRLDYIERITRLMCSTVLIEPISGPPPTPTCNITAPNVQIARMRSVGSVPKENHRPLTENPRGGSFSSEYSSQKSLGVQEREEWTELIHSHEDVDERVTDEPREPWDHTLSEDTIEECLKLSAVSRKGRKSFETLKVKGRATSSPLEARKRKRSPSPEEDAMEVPRFVINPYARLDGMKKRTKIVRVVSDDEKQKKRISTKEVVRYNGTAKETIPAVSEIQSPNLARVWYKGQEKSKKMCSKNLFTKETQVQKEHKIVPVERNDEADVIILSD